MTTLRRLVIRPTRAVPADSILHRKLASRREQLEREQASLSRWMSRMRRAFHTVEKQQKKVARLEREIERLSSSESERQVNRFGPRALPVRLLSL
jgi:hypothetical protein